jgi:tRNA(Ile)-lysidine synthase
MRSRHWFHAGQRVGVGVSGGPDSVLLLHFVKKLGGELGFTVAAVHFNHHLRGAESDGDEKFVRELAGSLKVNFLRGQAEIARVARERHANIEAIAREFRYRYFFSLMEQGRLDLVTTAHTANDQAETVLMRLIRGSGTRGLGGIYPMLDGKIARPFLSLTRKAIMQEIAAQNLSYRVDSTNLTPRLRRNKIRMELLPLLESEYNPQIVTLLNQFADRARDDEATLEKTARERSFAWRVREGQEEKIPIRALEEFPPALARRVLRQMLQSVNSGAQGLSHTHIEALWQFARNSQSGKSCELPGGMLARKEFSWLAVSSDAEQAVPSGYSYPAEMQGNIEVPEIRQVFRFKIVPREDVRKAYNLKELGGLDPQKLGGALELRNWRSGDRYCPAGTRGARKLKEFFRERKIPGLKRGSWPVLTCAGEIVWVRGFPPAKNVVANDETPRVLIIEEEPLGEPAVKNRA